jgi:acyl carrier protein
LDTKKKVKTIIADTFKLDFDQINDDTGPENVSQWDSFGEMTLVLALEKEFGFVLEYEEIFKISSTGTLIELVEEKSNEI